MTIKNIHPHSSNKPTHLFFCWKRTSLALLGCIICCFTALHVQQVWRAYHYYQQATSYYTTEQQYTNLQHTVQQITEQNTALTQQLHSIQTQCTPIVNPAGIFTLDQRIPHLTLHEARITTDTIWLTLTLATTEMAELDTQLRTLFCDTPLIQSIKKATSTSDASLLTISCLIKPAAVCPTALQ